MIWISQRIKIERLFFVWCEENRIAETPSNMVAFLAVKDWLNEEKISEEVSIY